MDPLSIAGSVVGLTATCLQTAKALHDLKDRFKYADVTIAAICTETTIISVSLSRIQSSMLSESSSLGEKLQESSLSSTLDAALTGCYVVFDVLQSEINKLIERDDIMNPEPLGFKGKTKLIWNESLMQELLGQLRGLQTSLTLLLQLLTTDTMAELKQMMEVNVTVLSQVVDRTRRFRTAKQSRAPESIFDMSFTTLSIHQGDGGSVFSNTMFQFDDEIINSQTYRRTLARAYAAIEDRADEETAESSKNDRPASERDTRTQSVISTNSSDTALGSNLVGSHEQDYEVGDILEEVPAYEEDIERFLKRQSIYTVYMPEWAGQWKMSNQEISGVPKRQLERQFIIHELIQTERRYLKQLLILRYLYKHRWILTFGPERWDTPKMTNGFPGGERIFQLNKKHVYEPLIARQASQGPWILSVADIFENWVSLSAPAYLEYSETFAEYHDFITNTARNNAAFSQFLSQARNHILSDRLDWTTYLKAPLDRLQRYILLLEVILKKSDRQNPDHEFDRMEKVIASIRASLVRCDVTISQARKSITIQRFNSRITSKSSLLPLQAEIVIDLELKLKRRTMESSIPVQFVMYRSEENLKIMVFKHMPGISGFNEPGLELLDRLEDLASMSHSMKRSNWEVVVRENVLESPPWRFYGFPTMADFGNFKNYMTFYLSQRPPPPPWPLTRRPAGERVQLDRQIQTKK